MGKHIHKLTELNTESCTAVCASCGNVSVRKKGTVWYCTNGARLNRGKRGSSVAGKKNRGELRIQPHGLTVLAARAFRIGKSCEICGDAKNLNVDHCHATKKIRGILCTKCNTGLGFFRDSLERLNAAIKYLTK